MEYINIIIAAVLVNNLLLTEVLGIDSTISSTNSIESAVNMGLQTTLVTTITAILTKLVYDNILVKFDLQIFEIISFVLIITIVITIYNSIIARTNNDKKKSLEQFTPMIVANSLILGVSLLVVENSFTLLQTLVYSIGVSFGFTIVLILISAINHKYRYSNMPRQYREKATTLLALGLVALAFYGFKGLV